MITMNTEKQTAVLISLVHKLGHPQKQLFWAD